MLAEVARWFKCSTLRREDFQQVFSAMNDEYVHPSKFITPSTTRWLVNGKCIFSILSQWHELKAYFSVIGDKENNYHARVLNEMLADHRNFLYLTFLCYQLFKTLKKLLVQSVRRYRSRKKINLNIKRSYNSTAKS